MYWRGDKWKNLWQKEAKEKFREFIEDYLINFPKGCFGLIEGKEILGAMFFTKISKFKTIPYLHRVSEYLEVNGRIAYVSLFVIKDAKNKDEIGRKLYEYAEEVAVRLACKTIEVVIYSSPLEEQIIKENNYRRLKDKFDWEIYSGMKVPSRIFYYNLKNYFDDQDIEIYTQKRIKEFEKEDRNLPREQD